MIIFLLDIATTQETILFSLTDLGLILLSRICISKL